MCVVMFNPRNEECAMTDPQNEAILYSGLTIEEKREADRLLIARCGGDGLDVLNPQHMAAIMLVQARVESAFTTARFVRTHNGLSEVTR